MKLFFRVKRVDGLLWAKMYSDCKYPWYAASRLVANAKEAKTAFVEFKEGIIGENIK